MSLFIGAFFMGPHVTADDLGIDCKCICFRMNRSNRTFDASGLTGLELTERSFRAPKSEANSHLEERLVQANESRKEKLEIIRRYVAEMKEDLHGSVN